MSPDVANLTQQRGQPGQKACHGLGGASLQPWPEDEGMEKGGGALGGSQDEGRDGRKQRGASRGGDRRGTAKERVGGLEREREKRGGEREGRKSGQEKQELGEGLGAE